MLNNIRIILVETTHPGNIGAAARAMKTMGLKHLYLVQPKIFPNEEAVARASGADDILENAVITDSLIHALSDCSLVIGTSARKRDFALPMLNPRECSQRLVQNAHASLVGLVFGREHSGLTNQELELCHFHVQIPTQEEFSSLNIAAAVQVLAYEIRMTYLEGTKKLVSTQLPNHQVSFFEMEQFYNHLEKILIAIDFLNPQHPKKLMSRLRRLFNRAGIDPIEINILRGILAAIDKHITPK